MECEGKFISRISSADCWLNTHSAGAGSHDSAQLASVLRPGLNSTFTACHPSCLNSRFTTCYRSCLNSRFTARYRSCCVTPTGVSISRGNECRRRTTCFRNGGFTNIISKRFCDSTRHLTSQSLTAGQDWNATDQHSGCPRMENQTADHSQRYTSSCGICSSSRAFSQRKQ